MLTLALGFAQAAPRRFPETIPPLKTYHKTKYINELAYMVLTTRIDYLLKRCTFETVE